MTPLTSPSVSSSECSDSDCSTSDDSIRISLTATPIAATDATSPPNRKPGAARSSLSVPGESFDSLEGARCGWLAGERAVALVEITYGDDRVIFAGDLGTVLGPHPTKRGQIKVAWDRLAERGEPAGFSTFFEEITNEDPTISIWGTESICGLWSSDVGHMWICPHEEEDGHCAYEEAPLCGGAVCGTLRPMVGRESALEQLSPLVSPGLDPEHSSTWWLAEVQVRQRGDDLAYIGDMRLRSVGRDDLQVQIRSEGQLSPWSELRQLSRRLPEARPRVSASLAPPRGADATLDGIKVLVTLSESSQLELESTANGVVGSDGYTVELAVKAAQPGRIHFVITPQGAEPPDAQRVRSGEDAAGVALAKGQHGTVRITGEWATIRVSGLLPGTCFDLYLVHDTDSVVNYSGMKVLQTVYSRADVVPGLSTCSHVWFWKDDSSGRWIPHAPKLQARLEAVWSSRRQSVARPNGISSSKAWEEGYTKVGSFSLRLDGSSARRAKPTSTSVATKHRKQSKPSGRQLDELHAEESQAPALSSGLEPGTQRCLGLGTVVEGGLEIGLDSMLQRHQRSGASQRIVRRQQSVFADCPSAEGQILQLCSQYADVLRARETALESAPRWVSRKLEAAKKMISLAAHVGPDDPATQEHQRVVDDCMAAFMKAQEAVKEAAAKRTTSSADKPKLKTICDLRDQRRVELHTALKARVSTGERLRAFLQDAKVLLEDLAESGIAAGGACGGFDVGATERGSTDESVAEWCREQLIAIYAKHNVAKAGDIEVLLTKYKGKEPMLYRKVCNKYGIASKQVPVERRSSHTDPESLLKAAEQLLQDMRSREDRERQNLESATDAAHAGAQEAVVSILRCLQHPCELNANSPTDVTRLATFSRALAHEISSQESSASGLMQLERAVLEACAAAARQLQERLGSAWEQSAIVAELTQYRDVQSSLLCGPPPPHELDALEDAMYAARDAHAEALDGERRASREVRVGQRRRGTSSSSLDSQPRTPDANDEQSSRLCKARQLIADTRCEVQGAERAYRHRVLELRQLKHLPEGFPEIELPLSKEEEEVFDVLSVGRRIADYDELRLMQKATGRCPIFHAKYGLEDCVLKEVRSLSQGGALRRELLARRRLPHPLVVPVLAAFEEEDPQIAGHFTAYLHLPLYPSNLEEWLDSEDCTLTKVRLALRDVLLVVAHVHAQGIVHGDLKPSNFLMNDRGQPCLTDFEMSRVDVENSSGMTTVVVGGSKDFISPEFPEMTEKTDVYALGAVSLRLLARWLNRWPASFPREREALYVVAERMMKHSPDQRPTASQALLEASQILGTGFSLDSAPPLYWQQACDQSTSRVPVADDENLGWPMGVGTRAHLSFALERTLHMQCLTQLFGGARPVVRSVERLESSVLWRRYCLARERIASHGLPAPIDPPVGQEHPMLDAACNECWLWHGTRWNSLDAIMAEGLDEHLSQLNGLYGGGIYFSDEACKALQYTDAGDTGDTRCLLYCRVTLGRPYFTRNTLKSLRTLKRLPEMHQRGDLLRPPDPAGHDCVVASRGAMVGHPSACGQLHREFVIFDGALAYPEFVVSVGRRSSNGEQ